LKYKISISCFVEDFDLISKVKNSSNESRAFAGMCRLRFHES
jgi:hypothetical protein